MKTIKITLATLLAFALTGLASAQSPVVLRITGSTAYRAATLVAISNILKSGYKVGYVASAAEPYSKANMVLFTGTTTSGVSVEIKTAFFGSIGGVANVAGGDRRPWRNRLHRRPSHRLAIDQQSDGHR